MMRVAAAFLALCLLAGITPAKSQTCPNPYANGLCAPVTANATGTTGAITATLPAAAGKTTYICGFHFFGTNATAANTGTSVTVTGTITGTMTFGFTTLAGVTVANSPALDETFVPCIAASALNTTIAVNGPALGTAQRR